MRFFRSFFTLYIFIISLFIFSSWLVDEVWRSYIEKDIDSYSGYKTMLTIVGDYLEKHPQEKWPELIANINKKYSMPIDLMPFKNLENAKISDKRALIKGNTYVYYDDNDAILHHLLPNSQTLITLGPAKLPTRPRIEALIRVAILCLFSLVLYIWLKPMTRDLDRLRQSTKKFGQGDFDIKAPNAQSSMIEPMIESFNMMAARIKRLIDAHKELSSAVAHELRTPLARSKFALQMLSNTDDEEKRTKYSKQINNDIHELEGLINEMLIYASFDSDKPELNFAPIHVGALVESLFSSYINFDGKLIFNNKAADQFIDCDHHFISRALNNYISNAIKYGKDTVKVTLSVENEQCVLMVEDNGKGVSDEFKDIIFDAFSRGDESRNRETGGFGLGLAIVCRIMEWHKGEAVIADSELGGAAFILKWPIKLIH